MAASTAVKLVTAHTKPVIETSIPIPQSFRSPLMIAFSELAEAEIGASFFVHPTLCSVGGQIGERANRVGGKGWVTIRKVDGGHRVWKIAEPKTRA